MSLPEVTRRQFMRALPLTAAALSACNRVPYTPEDFAVAAVSPVALMPASSYAVDLADVIGRGLDLLKTDVRGRHVFLKPNVVEYESDKAINTHPSVVAGAIQAFLTRGASRVTVGEGPGHRRDLEYLLAGTGLDNVLSTFKVEFVDLNHDDVARVSLRSNYTGLNEIWLPESLLRADFVVSMPKLKTHHFAGLTASMKNLFGTVPGAVYGWPKNPLHFHGIEQSILDLNATVRPSLAIVDGIIGMEGDGPIMGRPRPLGFVAIGPDLPAVDATCARVIGLDPVKMPYLSLAGAYLGNVNERRIEQRGESLQRYRTQFDVIEPIRKLRL